MQQTSINKTVPQVRNGQLEKEARELRAENSSLLADVESSTQATATSQQVPAALHEAPSLGLFEAAELPPTPSMLHPCKALPPAEALQRQPSSCECPA